MYDPRIERRKSKDLRKKFFNKFIPHLDSQIRKNHNDILTMKKSHILHLIIAVPLVMFFLFISSIPISAAPQ